MHTAAYTIILKTDKICFGPKLSVQISYLAAAPQFAYILFKNILFTEVLAEMDNDGIFKYLQHKWKC